MRGVQRVRSFLLVLKRLSLLERGRMRMYHSEFQMCISKDKEFPPSHQSKRTCARDRGRDGITRAEAEGQAISRYHAYLLDG